MAAALIAEALDMKDAKIIPGFKGTSEVALALGRGEIDGCTFNNAANVDFVQKGVGKPLITLWTARVEPFADTTRESLSPPMTMALNPSG